MQCAVRAALEGRVLVLEGIEKAERNVLPILNNLLENRELALDDGRFLMAPATFDALLQSAHLYLTGLEGDRLALLERARGRGAGGLGPPPRLPRLPRRRPRPPHARFPGARPRPALPIPLSGEAKDGLRGV